MADDIVTSLREMATNRARHATHYDGCDQSHLECAALRACDEIERLRAERDDHKARLAVEAVTAPDADYDTMVDSLQARLSDLHAEIERLCAAGDALAAAHADDLCDCDQSECVAIRAAHDAWQEARRG